MTEVTILTERELRGIVGLDREVVDAIEDAFVRLADGKVEMPPIMHIDVKENAGDVDIKSAYVRGVDQFAVKIGAGFFNNHKLGLPNSPASVVLVSSKTGVVEAVLLDNAYLTDVRTGAAGAVAAKHLAKQGPLIAGILGTGVQARYQLEALKVVREVKRAVVWGRDGAKAKAYAEEMTKKLGIEVAAASSAEEAVRVCDVLVTTTNAKLPLVRAEWLKPGLHITAMGADLAGKQELDPAILGRADRVVCDRRTQCEKMGELQHALASGAIKSSSSVAELGEVAAGRAPGRTSDSQITVCDLTGTGVQDTAIGVLAFRRAKAKGLGTIVRN
ncbi:MAG: cyclodeaminase [Alphaproteobacteria bacterium]|nr:cyclodeaminase [Alphaproteobacteria bacterium]